MKAWKAHQTRLAQGRQLQEAQQKSLRERNEAAAQAGRQAMRPHFQRLFPELMDSRNDGNIKTFLDKYGFTGQDLAGITNPRVLAVFASAYRYEVGLANGRKAASAARKGGAPKIIRGKRRVAKRGASATARSFVRDGGSPAHVRAVGGSILGDMQ